MNTRASILHKRIEIWTSFSPEISKALSNTLVAQGVLLMLSSMILDGGVLLQFIGFTSLVYWITIFPILWRRPKTTNKFELGLIRIGFICLLPLSIATTPTWGWLRELIK